MKVDTLIATASTLLKQIVTMAEQLEGLGYLMTIRINGIEIEIAGAVEDSAPEAAPVDSYHTNAESSFIDEMLEGES